MKILLVLLLSHLVFDAASEMFWTRDLRAAAFNKKYSDLQSSLAPHLSVPWPALFMYTEDFVLLWAYSKVVVAIAIIFNHRLSSLLQNMLMLECLVQILGGCMCRCYFTDRLIVVVGLMCLPACKATSKLA